VAACGTTAPTRFYTLSSLPGSAESPRPAHPLAIGIGPVDLPAYLDRPEIVTRRGPNELELSEFHRWAEPLGDNVTRVLVEDLSVLLAAEPVFFFPFPSSQPLHYRVPVTLLNLEGKLGESASLLARWTLLTAEGQEALPLKESSFSESTQGPGYEALVSAQSRALGALSREIAGGIQAVLQGTPKR
jgi:hypothetical protein